MNTIKLSSSSQHRQQIQEYLYDIDVQQHCRCHIVINRKSHSLPTQNHLRINNQINSKYQNSNGTIQNVQKPRVPENREDPHK